VRLLAALPDVAGLLRAEGSVGPSVREGAPDSPVPAPAWHYAQRRALDTVGV